MRVLSVNCGSSSLKYALFEVEQAEERALSRGAVERIGEAIPDHGAAMRSVLDQLRSGGFGAPEVIGHRVVHGGERSEPARVDSALIESLTRLVPFAPLHLPAEIRAIEAVSELWPDRPQVASFDTAFHRTLPEEAQRYALPEKLYQRGVHRYGFHGLSYEYVVSTIGAGPLGRAVLAHLGSGASMVAVRDGRAIDTTMGFTPSGGLVMATRPGDLDPGLVVYLVEQGHDAPALADLFNHRSGLFALSGGTTDVRDLLAHQRTDPRAALALAVFAWSARRWIGAMSAAIGGLDTLVFTGGIGEHAAELRTAIASGLEYLGVSLDPSRNSRGEGVVSSDGASCRVLVVRTDEERMVARHARRIVTPTP
jgi:acetate kinase